MGILETGFRNFKFKREGQVGLDSKGVIYYSRYENNLDLHIKKGLTQSILREVVGNLLRIIKEDASIEKIVMTSWVVDERLEFFKKLGFQERRLDNETIAAIRADLPKEFKERPLAEVYMSREDFIKLAENF